MKILLILHLLLTSCDLFAFVPIYKGQDLSLTQLKDSPKKEIILLEIKDKIKDNIKENPLHIQRSYHFGKVPKYSLIVIEYRIKNLTNSSLEFKNAMRSNQYHIKGGHTCNRILGPEDECLLYVYFNPSRWGNHSGRVIIEFTQDVTIEIMGSGKARYN